MGRIKSVLSVACCLLMAGVGVSSRAETGVIARISSVNGQVLVNQGHGFRPARSGLLLREGDRLISMHGGQALISYAAGCAKPLDAGSLLTINGAKACQPLLIKASTNTVLDTQLLPGIFGGLGGAGGGAAGGGGLLSGAVTIGGVTISKTLAVLLLTGATGGAVGGAALDGAFTPASP